VMMSSTGSAEVITQIAHAPNQTASMINIRDRLHLLGNGVVPATAALAFTTLINNIDNNTTKK
jgi:hypothetical protein